MQFLKCPSPERLFEYVSIPLEMRKIDKTSTKLHVMTCSGCRNKIGRIQMKWSAYFKPEPEVTTSLMKVYSRLKNDETLILKGWKLDDARPQRRHPVQNGWMFRGAVGLGALSVAGFVMVTQMKTAEAPRSAFSASSLIPYAQIRVEDKNRVQVQYVTPELLESMEFQTNNTPKTESVSTGTFR